MSLLQRGHQLILALTRQARARCLQTARVALNTSKTQNGFVGLDNCFAWDDKHGFGFDKNGQVVIVKPNPHDATSQMFSSEVGNNFLVPELQMPQGNNEIPKVEEKLEDEDYDGENYPDYPACAGSRY